MYYFLAIVIIGFYFIPGIIAIARNKTNQFKILGLNALTGWTIVGWFVSFIWAMRNEVIDGDRPGRYDPIPSGHHIVMTDDEGNVDDQLDEQQQRIDDGKVVPLFNGHTNNARTAAEETTAIASVSGAVAGTTVTESAKGTQGTTVTGDQPER